jgi:hypothetical protein
LAKFAQRIINISNFPVVLKSLLQPKQPKVEEVYITTKATSNQVHEHSHVQTGYHQQPTQERACNATDFSTHCFTCLLNICC